MPDRMFGPRPGQSGSALPKLCEVPGWSIRLRPTWSEELPTPPGAFSCFDISIIFGPSIPFAASTKRSASMRNSSPEGSRYRAATMRPSPSTSRKCTTASVMISAPAASAFSEWMLPE